jgi:CRISPR-associated protein Csy3
VLANSLAPHACSDIAYKARIQALAQRYGAVGGYHYLARRYLANLLTGTWLWRNTFLAEQELAIAVEGKNYTFNIQRNDRDLEQFAGQEKDIEALTELFARGLRDRFAPVRFRCVLRGALDPLDEVFPSQAYVKKEILGINHPDRDVTKILSSIDLGDGRRQALFTRTKIGNALRRIDNWYQPGGEGDDSKDEPLTMLPAEPLGVDLAVQRAYRVAYGNTLYSVLEQQLGGIELAAQNARTVDALPDELHYIMACLIRGGVFNGSKEEA